MVEKRVLYVERDESQWSVVAKAFIETGHHFSAVPDGMKALKSIMDDHVDLVISELNLAPMTGLDLLKRIKDYHPSIPVVLVSAGADVGEAVEAMKHGAQDFIVKPLTPRTVDLLTDQVAPAAMRPNKPESNGKHTIITENEEMERLKAIAARIADSRASVFIQGESGT